MSHLSKIVLTFALAVAYTARVKTAENYSLNAEDINILIHKQYESGENTSAFHEKTSCCGRYIAYGKLCCDTESCTIKAPFWRVENATQAKQLISEHATSQPKTYYGKVINEHTFGPQAAEMSEAISTLITKDIENYFETRKHCNPERALSNVSLYSKVMCLDAILQQLLPSFDTSTTLSLALTCCWGTTALADHIQHF